MGRTRTEGRNPNPTEQIGHGLVGKRCHQNGHLRISVDIVLCRGCKLGPGYQTNDLYFPFKSTPSVDAILAVVTSARHSANRLRGCHNCKAYQHLLLLPLESSLPSREHVCACQIFQVGGWTLPCSLNQWTSDSRHWCLSILDSVFL